MLEARTVVGIRRIRSAGYVVAWVAWSVCLVTQVLIGTYDVKVVLATGPFVFALGLMVLALGYGARHGSMMRLGITYSLMCVGSFLSVIVFDLSPTEAETPFFVAGLILVPVLAIWCSRIVVEPPPMPEDVDSYRCQQCGYLLYGLREPRCPECGQAFDATKLSELSGRFPADGT